MALFEKLHLGFRRVDDEHVGIPAAPKVECGACSDRHHVNLVAGGVREGRQKDFEEA